MEQNRTAATTRSLDVASVSHQGMVRVHNEDAAVVDPVGLAVLADGMGGYNAGEVASGIAVKVIVDAMRPQLQAGRPLGKVDVASGLSHAAQLLQQQIALANKSIFEAAQAKPECAGMGTTLVVAVFYENRVCIAHVGDSRCYRLRGERLEQLTRDHSLLQEQIDSGLITAEQARYSLNKNLVTRALGIEAIVPADVSEYRLEVDDIYLLCSDGLTDMVEPDAIKALLAAGRGNLEGAARQLVDLANQNGGRDNITVVLVRIPKGFLAAPDWIKQWKQKPGSPAATGGSALPDVVRRRGQPPGRSEG
jgi:protein phosphatase